MAICEPDTLTYMYFQPASPRACAPASLTSPRKLPCVKKRRPTPRNDEMELVQVLIGQASRLRAWRSFPATSKRPQGTAEHWRALEWHWMVLSGYWQALGSIGRYLAGIQQAFGRHSAGISGQRCCLGVRAALDSSKDKIDERTVLPGLRRCRMTPLVFQGVVCRESVPRTGVPQDPLYPRATLRLSPLDPASSSQP